MIQIDFQVEPIDATVFAGQALTLNCVPPISLPPANVTWYKDNRPLVVDGATMSITGLSEGIWDLYIPSVQAINEGSYVCVAENNLAFPASRTSRVAVVTVQG